MIALLPLARFHEANFRAYLPGVYVRLGVLYLLTAGVLLVMGAIVWKSRHRVALGTARVPLQPERYLISRWSAPYVFMEIRD